MKLPFCLLLLCLFVVRSVLAQGSLTPPAAPAPSMKTLAQIEPRTPISAPYTISNSGSYYLTTNIIGVAGTNGITIQTGDVTLDLNGFALVGVPLSLNGIHMPSYRTNIAVFNGIVRGWGGIGVRLWARNIQCRSLIVSTNGSHGMSLSGSLSSIIKDCFSEYNGGQGIHAGSVALVENCHATANTGEGIYGASLTVLDCMTISNERAGIYAFNESRVLGCNSSYNTQDGIVLGYHSQAIDNNCVYNNSAASTNYAGIRTFYHGGRIDGNHIRYNSGFGILVSNSAGPAGADWVIVRNSTLGTLANAISAPAGNDVGPIGNAATATSPWANIRN
jgi:hypothetical protein